MAPADDDAAPLAEPDEISTSPELAPDPLDTLTLPLVLEIDPLPLTKLSAAPSVDVLRPPEMVTTPPVEPSPPLMLMAPPTPDELAPPDTTTLPPLAAAPPDSPPDTVTSPPRCCADKPADMDTEPETPLSEEPLLIDTTPLALVLTALCVLIRIAPLCVALPSPLLIVTLPAAPESELPLCSEMLDPAPVNDEPPTRSMPPALASPLPLPMRTDPLEALLLPVLTWMAPLLLEPLVLVDTTTSPLSETPAPLVTDTDPPVEPLDDPPSTETSPPAPCRFAAPTIFTR